MHCILVTFSYFLYWLQFQLLLTFAFRSGSEPKALPSYTDGKFVFNQPACFARQPCRCAFRSAKVEKEKKEVGKGWWWSWQWKVNLCTRTHSLLIILVQSFAGSVVVSWCTHSFTFSFILSYSASSLPFTPLSSVHRLGFHFGFTVCLYKKKVHVAFL